MTTTCAPRLAPSLGPRLGPVPADLLQRQAGVLSRVQAVRAGLDPREIDRLVARRRWVPLHHRVYLVAGHPFTDEARVRAAVLWAGDGAVLGGLAALWWHGLLRTPPPTVTLSVPRRCPDPRPGVLVRRQRLRPGDQEVLRGVAVAIRPLALLDAAVEAGARGPALLRALQEYVDPADLHAVAGRVAGAATAGRLLADVTSAPPRYLAE